MEDQALMQVLLKKKIIIMIIIKIKRSASGWAMGLGGFVKKKKKKC